MKKTVNIFDYASQISKAMKKGILLTTKVNGKVNTMTIGWGAMGIEWGKSIFTVFVRESRYTRDLLDQAGEFTVSIPLDDQQVEKLIYCGRNSGRDKDKIEDLKLTLEAPVNIQTPGIRELPLTIECKVLYQQKQDLKGIPKEIRSRFYPAVTAEGEPDYHIAYYGEILNAYIIQEES